MRETSKSETVRDGDRDRAEREMTQARGSREREREREKRGREEVGSGCLGPLVWECCGCVKKNEGMRCVID